MATQSVVKEAARRLKEARAKEAEGRSLPIGGKSVKMGLGLAEAYSPFTGAQNRKDAAAAYDKLQNMREEDVEVAEKRYKDLTGYKAGGRVKRYARGGGIESKGKTRGKMV